MLKPIPTIYEAVGAKLVEQLESDMRKPTSLWWLSFCDMDKPTGQRFVGVAIIRASDFESAVTRAKLVGAYPKGDEIETQGQELDNAKAGNKYDPFLDRLLSRAESDPLIDA